MCRESARMFLGSWALGLLGSGGAVSPKPLAFPLPAQEILLEGGRAMTEHLLLFSEFPRVRDLLCVDERALFFSGISDQPIKRAGGNFPSHWNSQIHRIMIPVQLIENDNDPGVVRFHPIRKRAIFPAPTAVEMPAGVFRAIVIIITTGARAVWARMARIYRDAINDHLYPAVTTPGARTAFSFSVFIQDERSVLSRGICLRPRSSRRYFVNRNT